MGNVMIPAFSYSCMLNLYDVFMIQYLFSGLVNPKDVFHKNASMRNVFKTDSMVN